MNDMLHVQTVCSDISAAVINVRACLRGTMQRYEILDRFWSLQDCLHRLVEYVSDEGPTALETLKQECPHLITNVIDVLISTERNYLRKIPAVADACHAIIQFIDQLNELEHSCCMAATM